jgi:hypothetical protein
MSVAETPKRFALDADELKIVEALSKEDNAQIDRWLVESATSTYQKVAIIVAKAIEASDLAHRLLDVPDTYFAMRIAVLVAAGALEARGDPHYMRHSEVRLMHVEERGTSGPQSSQGSSEEAQNGFA